MNKYGYFIFEDYPSEQNVPDALGTPPLQSGSAEIEPLKLYSTEEFVDYASFEQHGFDFSKPVKTPSSTAKMAATTQEASGASGTLSGNRDFFLTFLTPEYSGSGFTVKTFNNDYTLEISVTDDDNPNTARVVEFEKTEDEFYPFVFNGLRSVHFRFNSLEPYHFVKFIGYRLGALRELTESDIVGEPTIVNNFSLTSENIDYDTLDLTIRGDKTNFNIQAGERLTYTTTGQEFYVSTSHQNNDGTIDISCYDKIAMLENEFEGVYATNGTISAWFSRLLSGGGVSETANVLNTLNDTNKFEGTIEPETYKEALEKLLRGTGTVLKRVNNHFTIYNPAKYVTNELVTYYQFTEHNIVDGAPEIDTTEPYYKLTFTKPELKIDTSEGRVEAFNGEIETGDQTLQFSEPFQSCYYYRVTAIVDDEQQLEPLPSANVTFITDGAYYAEIRNGSGSPQTIVAKGYPLKSTDWVATYTFPNVPSMFKQNVLDVTDLTVFEKKVNNTLDPWRFFLKYVYERKNIAKFSSVLNAEIGEYAYIVADGYRIGGWITKKTDKLNGVYEYEVMFK